MKIRVLTIMDRYHARDEDGKKYTINGLIIRSQNTQKADRFYFPSSSFFKAACPPGTYHKGEVLENGLVNIY